jgi:RNA polymerase sigma-70 factor (ECF subfamily)
LDEKSWIRATLDGNKEAFAEIVQNHQVAVFNLAYRMLGNRAEAEDAAQESFVRAYMHLASYNMDQKFATWLLSITAHHCIDLLRRSGRVRTEPVDSSNNLRDQSVDPERHAVASETDREIRSALDLLPENYRAIVILRFWYDMSYKEIGQVVGLNEGVVKVRLHRARAMLARLIAQPNGDEDEAAKNVTRTEGTENNALFAC